MISKNLKAGSKVYCHTSDYHMFDHHIFVSGEYYTIVNITKSTIYIKTNEQGTHIYDFEHEDFENYFNSLARERKEKLKNLYNVNKGE